MSYQLKLDAKSRKVARFISRLQSSIQQALVDSGKTQQQVAEILGVDRSVINRRLKGSANITARSMAEFAYALDKDITVTFVKKAHTSGANWATSASKIFDTRGSVSNPTVGKIGSNQKVIFESTAP